MKKGVVVNMQNDLEARPIALLVQKANQFSSQIYMESGDNKRVNVKSIMGMMSMALLNGEEVVIDGIIPVSTVMFSGTEQEIMINALFQ